MNRYLLTLGLLFLAQICSGQPVIQNKTITVRASQSNIPYIPTIAGILGPVQGGIPPYTFSALGPIEFPLVISPNGHFALHTTALPLSFQYTARDSQGHTSAPATVTIIPGANLQEETPGLSDVEPG